MGFKRCPGSSTFAQPKIELLPCPGCGGDVEIWSDEPIGTCPACGRTAMRTLTQSCMDWCKFAEECLGEAKYKQYQDMKSAIRKEALVEAAADRFQWNRHQLGSVWEALALAGQLLSDRPEADPNVVMAAVVLRFGCEHANKATGVDGQAVAQAILESLDYPDAFVRQVGELLAPSGPEDASDINAGTVRVALNGDQGSA